MAATGRTGTLCLHPAARATSKEQVHTALAAKEAIAVKTPAGRKCSRILERPQHCVRACGKSERGETFTSGVKRRSALTSFGPRHYRIRRLLQYFSLAIPV